MALAIGAGVGTTIFSLITPRLLGQAVDHAHGLLAGGPTGDAAVAALWRTGALVVAAAGLRGLLQALSGYGGEWMAQRVGLRLRLELFDKLQRLGFDYHDRQHSGDLITRGMLDLEGVRGFLENGLQRAISLALLIGAGAWMLFSVDPLMAALAFSFVPVFLARSSLMSLKLRRIWTALQEQLSVLTRVMEECLQGVRVVRAFAATDIEMAKFDVAARDALALSNRRTTARAGNMNILAMVFYGSMALVLWVGGLRVQNAAMSIGQLTEILALMSIMQMPVRQVGMVVNSSARAMSSGRRLFDILDREPVVRDAPAAVALPADGGRSLTFERVSFAYGPGGPPALHDVSFTLRRGQTLGIVGPSGAGKTTLAHLIPRFYDVGAGRILVDDHDIRHIALASLRGAAAVVAQDVFLFDGSAGDNIAYADRESDEARLFAAAVAAQIHDHLNGLPEGYDTHIGERGVRLSGGQRQRLSIARGILPDPPILVLDDVASALDAATEQRLLARLRQEARRKAVIIIAHRLSAVMHADEILVLDHGRVAERGSHAALLALGGRYRALYDLQSGQADAMSRENAA